MRAVLVERAREGDEDAFTEMLSRVMSTSTAIAASPSRRIETGGSAARTSSSCPPAPAALLGAANMALRLSPFWPDRAL